MTTFSTKLLSTTILTAAGLMAFGGYAKAGDHASPLDGTNVAGSSTTTQTDANSFYTQQTTDRAATEYYKPLFLGSDQSWHIQTPGSGSISAHLVKAGSGADPTQILGFLSSNGRVIIVDGNGVFFGHGSRVDVAGLVASTGNVGIADIMDGDGRFEFSDFGDGKIELQGTVTVADAGIAAFVSPFVSNSGLINAKVGKVAFAAGDKVTLDLYGDELIEIAVNDKTGDALLENSGTINAEGGQVIMTAQAAKQAVDNVINMSGVINASSASVQGGKIVLGGGSNGKVSVSGKIDASGATGGTVEIKGEKTEFTGDITAQGDGAFVEVSGGALSLGGTIAVNKNSIVTFDPVTFTVGAAEAATFVTALSGGGTVNVSAEELIVVNAAIDSSAQANSATLNFKDEGGAAGLQVDLNEKIKLGANQNLKGDATIVNVANTGLIQNGVDVSATGATVNVAAGTYNESVQVRKSVTLLGANAGTAGYATRGLESIVTPPAGKVGFHIEANDVTIDGFKIDGASHGVHVEKFDNAKIQNNIIINNSVDAIWGEGTASKALSIEISGNYIDTSAHDAINVRRFEDVNIHNNLVQNQGDEGIEVTIAKTVNVSANNVYNSGDDAIQVKDASETVTVNDNITSGSDSDGVEVGRSGEVHVSGNQLAYSNDQGIELYELTSVTATGNTIYNTLNEGVFARNIYGAIISANTISLTGRDGIHIRDFDNAAIQSNTIDQTGDDGIEALRGTRSVLITHNKITNAGFYAANADYYGADAIHVRNVNRYNSDDSGYELTQSEGGEAGNGNGFGPFGTSEQYSVIINNNIIGALAGVAEGEEGPYETPPVAGAKDDGIEVVGDGWITEGQYGTGRTLIAWNEINNVGTDGTVGPYGADSYGSDGIHVRGVMDTAKYSSGEEYPYPVYELALVNEIPAETTWTADGYGYSVEILENTVTNAGDDGVEVLYSGKKLVSGNEVDTTGVAFNDVDYYSYNDGDGIHIEGTYGEIDAVGPDENAVEVLNNDVKNTGDDGVEVLNSAQTLIAGNNITNAGFNGEGNGTYYIGDYTGADGIHVNNVFKSYGGYDDEAGLVEIAGEDPSGFYGYSVNIFDNIIDTSGDDGIEVTYSASTLIDHNTISHSGTDGLVYFGGGDYTGADGIHVKNVYGEEGYAYARTETEYGFTSYAVVVKNNRIDVSADDGVEVTHSGRTLVKTNHISNSGYGDGYPYGGDDQDGWGHDGIHVRNVYADDEDYYEVDLEDVEATLGEDITAFDLVGLNEFLRASDISYDVEVIGNIVETSEDDGIEVTYNEEREIPTLTKEIYEGDEWEYDYNTTTVGVFDNTVSVSGDDGIDVTNANYVFVDGNGVTTSGGDGITVNRDGSDDDIIYGLEQFSEYVYYDDGYFPNVVVVTDNTVDDSTDDGIEVQGYGIVLAGENIVTDSGDDGIIVHDLLYGGYYEPEYPEYPDYDDYDYAEVTLVDPYYSNALVIAYNNSVDNSGSDGIQVDSFGSSYGEYSYGATVFALDNAVTDSGANGFYASGPYHNYVYVAGNAFERFDNGAKFESGLIDLTGATNFFFDGNVGLLFSPYEYYYGEGSWYASMYLVDDDAPGYETFPTTPVPANFGGTIGEQFFTGQTTAFVKLENRAFFDEYAGEAIWLNGLNSTYVTPFGAVKPADTGGLVPTDIYNYLEDMFIHYPDTGNTGIFWFGVPFGAEDGTIAQEDILNKFDVFNGHISSLNVTLLGLPRIPGAGGGGGNLSPSALNAIETFAGGDADGTFSPEELNAIEAAAGGNDETGQPKTPVNCWSDAVSQANAGGAVNYSYGTSSEETLAGAAACGGTEL